MEFLPKKPSKSKVNCCVPQCISKAGRDRTLSFHHFPNDGQTAKIIKMGEAVVVDLKQEWINQLCIRKPVTKSMSVCSRHFKKENYYLPDVMAKRRCLKKDAIPSENLPCNLNLDEKPGKTSHKIQLPVGLLPDPHRRENMRLNPQEEMAGTISYLAAICNDSLQEWASKREAEWNQDIRYSTQTESQSHGPTSSTASSGSHSTVEVQEDGNLNNMPFRPQRNRNVARQMSTKQRIRHFVNAYMNIASIGDRTNSVDEPPYVKKPRPSHQLTGTNRPTSTSTSSEQAKSRC